jgi:transposase
MQDTELYRAILGLESPWTVARVDLDVKQQRVDVYAEHGKRKTWTCPECEASCGLHDHDEERTWRHLDSCQFQTYLHASVPRIRCDEHGVRQVRVPWAEPRSRFTLLFERFAIDVLHETDILGAARILAITWDEAHGIMARAVARGLSRRQHTVPEYVGLDEKSIARGQTYATIACDLTDGHVIDVAPERTWESVVRCFGRFSLNDMAGIKAVAMDMWQPFIAAITTLLPEASTKIVFDRFHIVSHMNHAVDMVRRRENRSLRAVGDERLVGSKYLWLYGTENVPQDRFQDFYALRSANLKTSRAWASKETLRALSPDTNSRFECGGRKSLTRRARRMTQGALSRTTRFNLSIETPPGAETTSLPRASIGSATVFSRSVRRIAYGMVVVPYWTCDLSITRDAFAS